jgi:hypothetical protein
MRLQDKLDAIREDFENGRLPLVPTQAQHRYDAARDPVTD